MAARPAGPAANPAASPCVPFSHVYARELRALGYGKLVDQVLGMGPVAPCGLDPAEVANRRALFDAVGRTPNADPLSALCLSGGGIRSATFNLGVLQALARAGVLGEFKYLSSVSGGGYIAGWLAAWRERQHDALAQLGRAQVPPQADPLKPEPRPVDRLRQYSNYLTPRLGLFSADTWAMAAVILRNLILNWLVLVPLLAAAVAVPQVALVLAESGPHPVLGAVTAAIALACESFASFHIHRYHKRSVEAAGPAPESRIIWAAVLPLYAAAALLALAVHWAPWAWQPGVWPFALVWCVSVPLVGGWVWSMPNNARRAWAEFAALVVSGTVGAGLLVLLERTRGPLGDHPSAYVALALPALLGVYLLARTLFVAVAGTLEAAGDGAGPRALDAADHDREWWARLSGWVLALALIWLAVSALCLLGGYALDWIGRGGGHGYAKALFAAVGGVSGVGAALLGRSGASASGRGTPGAPPPLAHRVALAVAVPLFCALLVVGLAYANTVAGRLTTADPRLLCVGPGLGRSWLCGSAAAADSGAVARAVGAGLDRLGASDPDLRHLLAFLVVPFTYVLVAGLAGLVVNPNRFSLHGFYRNRLVRAYLGASNVNRTPDPFTGFANEDNLRLHSLLPANGGRVSLLPVINAALNLVAGEKLAWQQRKAESFSMTPLFCGNFFEGYRASAAYGGPGGITLGTALTISGAAANPNMGYHSSPLVTFVMTLFNARLGAWLGNTNARGDGRLATYSRPGPRTAIRPVLSELFGHTDDRSPYVNLSDGGHFDNLGLYEVVLRRCRYVVVSDAGRDPACGFEDLGNAIRKVRIDFGVEIRFAQQINIRPRGDGTPGLYCAVGEIDYSAVDGAGAQKGWLLYVKPALGGGVPPVPYDVYSYAQQSSAFPHESTADQWFDESQFESYRALGFYIMSRILRGNSKANPPALPLSLAELRLRATAYLGV